MEKFIVREDERDEGVSQSAKDAQSAAENYAESAWWHSGCERPDRTVFVESEQGKVTKWDVEGEAHMTFNASPRTS